MLRFGEWLSHQDERGCEGSAFDARFPTEGELMLTISRDILFQMQARSLQPSSFQPAPWSPRLSSSQHCSQQIAGVIDCVQLFHGQLVGDNSSSSPLQSSGVFQAWLTGQEKDKGITWLFYTCTPWAGRARAHYLWPKVNDVQPGMLIFSPTSTICTPSTEIRAIFSFLKYVEGSTACSWLCSGGYQTHAEPQNLINGLVRNYSSHSCSREQAKEGNSLISFNCLFFSLY